MELSNNCYHCGFPADSQFQAEIQNEPRYFCCIGCQAVSQAIHSNGLTDFYRFRDSLSRKPDALHSDYLAFDDEEINSDFVSEIEPNVLQARLHIKGITCAACVWLIEKYLNRLEGVVSVQVNSATHQGLIRYHSDKVKLSKIFQELHTIGFDPLPQVAQNQRQHWQQERKEYLVKLGVAGIAMMQAGMTSIALHAGDIQGIESQWQYLLRWVTLLFATPVIAFSARPFYQAAWRSLKMKHLVMDVPVSLALILAYSASVVATITGTGQVYFDSVAMFTFFLLLGRYLEKQTRLLNFQATADRAQLLPLTAQIKLSDSEDLKTQLIKKLQVGDEVWVPAGETIPCDGEVLDGQSDVDESLITGESQSILKTKGSKVIAGSHNGATGLWIKATAVGEQTQIAAIENLIGHAEHHRPKQVQLADKIASRFVAVILTLAALVFAYWWWADRSAALWITLSVLVVTCPCALSLATPAAITAGINRLRKSGVLVTGERFLDSLPKITRIVFDKTGTLTEGKLQIESVLVLNDQADVFSELGLTQSPSNQSNQNNKSNDELESKKIESVLHVASVLEEGSRHPIAYAFEKVKKIKHSKFAKTSDRKYQTGGGVEGRLGDNIYRLGTAQFAQNNHPPEYPGDGQWLLLSENHCAIAWIKLSDTLRKEAQPALHTLRSFSLSILSGDRNNNVQHVAQQLNIGDAHGALLPSDKLACVKQFQANGDVVLMVGDGINDVPVLSAADVSIAMGGATDLAQTKADAILLHNDLGLIHDAIHVATRTQSIIRQNLAWAIGYNVLALPLAICGWIPPWLAAIGMSLSSLVVVINALRVAKPYKGHL